MPVEGKQHQGGLFYPPVPQEKGWQEVECLGAMLQYMKRPVDHQRLGASCPAQEMFPAFKPNFKLGAWWRISYLAYFVGSTSQFIHSFIAMATPKNTSPHSRPSSAGLIKNNDSAIGTDRSSDSLEMRSHDKAAPELDFSKIQFAQAAVAESTIKLANVLIEDITKKLGPDPSRPNIPGLLDMFEAAFNITGKQEPKKLEGYIPILKEMEQSISGSMDELLSAKFSFEKESHKSKNEFMRKIIQVGAEVANSKVNWEFAVNSYREAKENAAISYKNDLQKAYVHEASQVKARSTNLLANEIIIHQSNANYAVKISEAIERYVELMATANNNLSQAFSQLSQELSTHWNSMTTGRTALMLSNHQNSLELWKAIKATYDRLG